LVGIEACGLKLTFYHNNACKNIKCDKGLREVNIIDVVIAEPDVEGDQLNNDGQVDQLTED